MNDLTFKRSSLKRSLCTAAVLILLSGVIAYGQTHSDFNRQFSFAQLNTWGFANNNVNASDLTGRNAIWDGYVRDAVTGELQEQGFALAPGNADFLVRYHLDTRKRQRINVMRDSWPGYMFSRPGRVYWRNPMWGSRRVFRTPYDESTLVLDILDSRTRELVWRGYDRRTINDKSEKTIRKSVAKLIDRFVKDVRANRRRIP